MEKEYLINVLYEIKKAIGGIDINNIGYTLQECREIDGGKVCVINIPHPYTSLPLPFACHYGTLKFPGINITYISNDKTENIININIISGPGSNKVYLKAGSTKKYIKVSSSKLEAILEELIHKIAQSNEA